VKHQNLLLFLIAAFFGLSCHYPVSPLNNYTQAKINFFSPKDTVLVDFSRVLFHFDVDTIHQNQNILEWNFSDSTSDRTEVSLKSYQHLFSVPDNYNFSMILKDTISQKTLDSVSGVIHRLPFLSELQMKKHFRIQIFCVVKFCGDTVLLEHLFDIDPYTKYYDQDLLECPGDKIGKSTDSSSTIKWQGNEFTLKYSNFTSWEFRGKFNNSNSMIDSASFHNGEYVTAPCGRTPQTADLTLDLSIARLPWYARSADTLQYQIQGAQIDQVITSLTQNWSMDSPFPNSRNYCFKTGNNAQSKFFVQIAFF
jgi:hypothetical protein